jgi:DNA invertase Pin-like site-specific DNA recombinase
MYSRNATTSKNTRPACPRCGKPVKIIDLYCRISEDYDGDGGTRSVDDQEADGRLTLAESGVCCYQVGEVWKDPDLSAWNRRVTRPEFGKMMERLRSREADGVWFYDATRFSRKPEEGQPLLDLAEDGLIVLSGESEYDLREPEGRKHFRDDLNNAAFESDRIQKRTRRGKRLKVKVRGRSNAAFRGFGRPGRVTRPSEVAGLDPEQPRPMFPEADLMREQSVIAEVVGLILGRRSLDSCADLLNERGFTTIYGKRWSGAALKQTLRAPSLCGLLEYKGEIIEGKLLPGPHALSVDRWRELQEFLDARRRGAPAEFYALSGIASCGKCGAPLYGRPEVSKKPYPDGSVRRSYWCQPIRRQRAVVVGCGGVSIDWQFLDEAVKEAVFVKLGDERNSARLAAQHAAGEESRQNLLAKIEKRRALGRDFASKYGAGDIEESEYEAFSAGNRKLIGELRRQLDELDVPSAPSVSPDDLEEAWGESLARRRGLVQEAFPRLTILPATRGKWSDPVDRIDWDGASLVDM